jgi:hypothetical protein
MKKQIRDEYVKEWERACNNLAHNFQVKYFGNGAESYWVADDIGGIFFINDYFFGMNDIVDFIKYGYGIKDMFTYYDFCLEERKRGRDPRFNIKTWIKVK